MRTLFRTALAPVPCTRQPSSGLPPPQALLVTSTYTANLAAFVTVQSIKSNVQDVAVRQWILRSLCAPRLHWYMSPTFADVASLELRSVHEHKT